MPRMTIARRWVGAAAAALLLLAGGYWLGLSTAALVEGDTSAAGAERADRHPDSPMDPGGRASGSFILLLYEDDTFDIPVDEDRLAVEYGEWAAAERRRGVKITGEQLAATGSLLREAGDEGKPLAGVDREAGLGRLVGYFIISDTDRERALEIAATNPHLRYGGEIVVRPIIPT